MVETEVVLSNQAMGGRELEQPGSPVRDERGTDGRGDHNGEHSEREDLLAILDLVVARSAVAVVGLRSSPSTRSTNQKPRCFES